MDLYSELGVRTFINAYRPLTRLGGSTLPTCVIEAMSRAAQSNVTLRELQRAVGLAIAKLTRNEAAYVSCGATSGITLAVAACMADKDPVLASRLPNTRGMRNEVVMHTRDRRQKSDIGIRCAGAKIVGFGGAHGGTEKQLRSAITARTAAIFSQDHERCGELELTRIVSIARDCNVPVLIDAAFAVPPRQSFWRFTSDLGADAVFISGGKGIRGPQSTGLVLGKQWIIDGCTFHGPPNDRIGRGMKVGKEELVGIYAAVKHLMSQDESFEVSRRKNQMNHVINSIRDLDGIDVTRLCDTRIVIAFTSTSKTLSYSDASRWLLYSSPSVYVEPSDKGLIVTTDCLEDGEEIIVSNQLAALLAGPFKMV